MARQRQPWYRKSTGWWMVEINGKQCQLARGKENKKEASAKFHRLMLELESNPNVEDAEVTIASLLDEYLVQLRARGRSERTLYERKRYLQLFAENYGKMKVTLLKAYHLESWVLQHSNWKSPETQAEAVKAVKTAFSWGHRSGLIEKNPVASVSLGGRVRRRPATRHEFAQLMRGLLVPSSARKDDAESKRRLREILIFIFFTGARPSEVSDLRWKEVDLSKGIATLTKHKSSRTQRNPLPRRIFLTPPIVRLLQKIFERGDNEEFVFVNTQKRPWARNSVQQNVKRVRERLGLPKDLSLYCLRHLFGTQASIRGVELATLSQLMGHTSTRMTEHYLHLGAELAHLRTAMHKATGQSRVRGKTREGVTSAAMQSLKKDQDPTPQASTRDQYSLSD